MTDPVAVPSMTTTPPFPDLADRAAGTYNLKAFNFGTHMSGPFNGELEAIVDAAYTNAVAANERASTATDKAALTAADAAQTALDRIQTGQDRTQTGLDRAAAAASAATIGSAAAFIDSNPVVKGSADATKQIRFEVDGLTTATTRVITVPNKDGTLAMTSDIGGLSGTATGTIDLLTGASIASAATINLNAATGNRVHITGATAITAVTLTRGPRTVIFDGILTLTHHATNNNLPGGANITTAAGDRAIYESDGMTVYCVDYIKASGTAVVSSPSGAMILLSTVTASGAATVDIDTTFNSTYDTYVIVGRDINGNGVRTYGLNALMKIGGAYLTTATYKYANCSVVSTGSSGVVAASATAVTAISLGPEFSDVASEAFNFFMYVFNPSSATMTKKIGWQATGNDLSENVMTVTGSGGNTGTGALTGIRFQPGGNTIYGTFRLYGIKNS